MGHWNSLGTLARAQPASATNSERNSRSNTEAEAQPTSPISPESDTESNVTAGAQEISSDTKSEARSASLNASEAGIESHPTKGAPPAFEISVTWSNAPRRPDHGGQSVHEAVKEAVRKAQSQLLSCGGSEISQQLQDKVRPIIATVDPKLGAKPVQPVVGAVQGRSANRL